MPAVFLFEVTQFTDSLGNPLNGGKINTYAAGTTTPLATYSESTGSSLNTNPVILDAAGRGQIWVTSAAYKFVIQDSAGVTLQTIDGINVSVPATGPFTSVTSTGDVTLQQSTAATAGANQSSNNFKLQSRYWTGSVDATNTYNLQDVLGTGANPTSTPTLTHSGTTGDLLLDISNVPLKAKPKILNSLVFYADAYTGSDASVKINAAITAAIAAGGGVVDCRGLGGSQTMSAAIAIGNASLVPVHVILPNTCTWTWSTNLGAGVNAVSLYPKSSISGPGSGEGNPCVLRAATGFTGNSVFALISVTANGDYYHASGFNVQVQSGATCTTAGTIVTGMADCALIESIHTIVNSGATCPKGLQVIKSGFGASLINCGVDASNNTGTTAVVCGDGASNLDNVNFISCSFVHPGQALPALSITGGAFTGVLNFYGLSVELGTGYDTTTALVQIAASVAGVQNFFGGRCNANIALATNYFFDVAAGSRINAVGCRIFGNSDVNAINDHNKGTVTIIADANGNIAPYSSYTSPVQVALGGGPTSTSFANAMLAVFPDASHKGIAVSNQNDSLINALELDSGLSAGQSTNIRFLDRNTAEWSITKTSGNSFRVVDIVDSNFSSLEFDQVSIGGNVFLNSQSTGSVQINKTASTGTGGTVFGDGAGNVVAAMSSAGKLSTLAGVATADYGVPAIQGTPQHLTGQVGNLGATNLYSAAPPAGVYRVSFDAFTTTSGTGTTMTVSIGWTDAGGAKTFTSASWALNSVTITGYVTGSLIINSSGAANITVSTTGTIGTSAYAIDAMAERMK